jgi:uncharacterized protein (DUF1697 family)
MRTFVALMRSINVGSTRKLPTADLRASCLARGLKRPETYIQSGNPIVDANRRADDLRRVLERELTSRFEFTVDVIVRSTADWGQYVAASPFAGDADAPPRMAHLYLPRDRVEPGAASALEQQARSAERIVLAGGALGIDYGPKGVHGSKLSPLLIDKACGAPATGCKWNSLLRISEMIEARG